MPSLYSKMAPQRFYQYLKVVTLICFSFLVATAHLSPSLFWQNNSALIFLFPMFTHFIKKPSHTIDKFFDPQFWAVERQFLFCVLIPLIFLGLSPEWASGEKPMDLSYLNYLSRAGVDLSVDPWISSIKTSYYTLGYSLSAIWAITAGLQGNEFYLFGLSLWLGLFLFALVLISGSWKKSLLVFSLPPLGALISLAGTFEFSHFWQMTRVYQPPFFSEFPLWSYLFYDLHPHVMAFSIVACLFAYQQDIRRLDLKGYHPWLFCLGLVLLFFINRWDFLFWTVAFFLSSFLFFSKAQLKNFVLPLTALTIFIILIQVFSPALQKIEMDLWNPINWSQKILPGFLLMQGAHGMALLFLSFKTQNKKLLILFCVMAFIFSFMIVIDPVNSVFKFQTSLHVLLLCSLLLCLNHYEISQKVLNAGLVLGSLTICLMLVHRGIDTENISLSATKFLEQHKKDEVKLIEFLQSPDFSHSVLVEAQSESFQYSGALISTYSGVPSFLGWKGHLKIRGVKEEELERRSSLISEIYRSTDLQQTMDHLKNERIDLIVLGHRERQNYRSKGLAKFAENPALFEHLFSSDSAHLFRVREASTWDAQGIQ